MNKQVYAALSLVCGLLGFNLIAIAQTLTYMQFSKYLEEGNTFPMVTSTGGFYKISALSLGIIAIGLSYLYYKSNDNNARLFAYLGGILGFLSVLLALLPVYLWFLE